MICAYYVAIYGSWRYLEKKLKNDNENCHVKFSKIKKKVKSAPKIAIDDVKRRSNLNCNKAPTLIVDL